MLVSKKRIRAIANGVMIAFSIALLSGCAAGRSAGREVGEQVGTALIRETGEQLARGTDDQAAREFGEQLAREAGEQVAEEAIDAIKISAKDAADERMKSIIQQVSAEVVAQACDSQNVEALFPDVFDAAYTAALEEAQPLAIKGFPISETKIRDTATEVTYEVLSIYCESLLKEWISR
jgi:hypothetical protein